MAKFNKINDNQVGEARAEPSNRAARQISEVLRFKLATIGGGN